MITNPQPSPLALEAAREILGPHIACLPIELHEGELLHIATIIDAKFRPVVEALQMQLDTTSTNLVATVIERNALAVCVETMRDALNAADDDIREHLQVCKYNLRGQINTGEIVAIPNPPMLVHEEGIARSEVVRKQIHQALAGLKGTR